MKLPEMFSQSQKRYLYTSSLALTALVLPLSEWLLSFLSITVAVTWLISGGLQRLPELIREKRKVLTFTGIWIVYLVWMLNTADLSGGLKALRLKLPLLLFPLVFGLSGPVSRKELKIILSAFIAGVVISSSAGFISGYRNVSAGISDPRDLSPFISHIRLSMMAVAATACAGWYYFTSERKSGPAMLFPLSALWLAFYILFIASYTGIFLLIVIISYTAAILAFSPEKTYLKAIPAVLTVAAVAAAVLLIRQEINAFYQPGIQADHPLPARTISGNPYRHDTTRQDIENGNKVWIFLCEPELRKSWNLRSTIPYDSLDGRKQVLKYTLIRYLASAGLTRDSAGLASLTGKNIREIEQGLTNIRFGEWSNLRTRIYETIWQIDYYLKGGNPTGHSLTQRIEFLRTGWNLFRERPLFGTGTGDLVREMKARYAADDSRLDPRHRFLPHNQYLTFLVSFGITGFFIILACLIAPLLKSRISRDYVAAVFMIILFLAMFWEDYLETHTGVSFFAYFYSLFVFGIFNNSDGNG